MSLAARAALVALGSGVMADQNLPRVEFAPGWTVFMPPGASVAFVLPGATPRETECLLRALHVPPGAKRSDEVVACRSALGPDELAAAVAKAMGFAARRAAGGAKRHAGLPTREYDLSSRDGRRGRARAWLLDGGGSLSLAVVWTPAPLRNQAGDFRFYADSVRYEGDAPRNLRRHDAVLRGAGDTPPVRGQPPP